MWVGSQVEAAMPSAQNLVLLAQLQAATRPLAKELAGLMLKQVREEGWVGCGGMLTEWCGGVVWLGLSMR